MRVDRLPLRRLSMCPLRAMCLAAAALALFMMSASVGTGPLRAQQGFPSADFAQGSQATPAARKSARRERAGRRSRAARARRRAWPTVAVPVAPAVPNPAPGQIEATADPNARTLSLRHLRTGERLTVVYRIGGEYQPDAIAALNWFFRDYRCRIAADMDPALLDLLWELQQELRPTKPIQVVSAFRSEGYNASLLRAGRSVDPDSQHMLGKAVDVIFPGVPLDRLRAAAAARGIGGVGAYPFSGPPFVHLDTGPVRGWEEPRDRPVAVKGRQRRVALDCDLRMSDVLADVSYETALAALPAGASAAAAQSLDPLARRVESAVPLGPAAAAPQYAPPEPVALRRPWLASNAPARFLIQSVLHSLGLPVTHSLSPDNIGAKVPQAAAGGVAVLLKRGGSANPSAN